MPIRVTIELIPFGDENKKETLAQVEIVNNLKGTEEKGNYDVSGFINQQDGITRKFYEQNVKGIKRGNVIYTV